LDTNKAILKTYSCVRVFMILYCICRPTTYDRRRKYESRGQINARSTCSLRSRVETLQSGNLRASFYL